MRDGLTNHDKGGALAGSNWSCEHPIPELQPKAEQALRRGARGGKGREAEQKRQLRDGLHPEFPIWASDSASYAFPALANLEAAKVFSLVLGKRVKFQRLPLPLVRLFLGKGVRRDVPLVQPTGLQGGHCRPPPLLSRSSSAHLRGMVARRRLAQASKTRPRFKE